MQHIQRAIPHFYKLQTRLFLLTSKQLYLRFDSFNKPNLCSFPKHKSDTWGLSQRCCFCAVGLHLPTFRFLILTHWDLSKRRELLIHRHSVTSQNVQRNGAGDAKANNSVTLSSCTCAGFAPTEECFRPKHCTEI